MNNTNCKFCDPDVQHPGNANMDQCVLSCMMQAPEFAVPAAAEMLKPDDFYTERCGLLFSIILRRHDAGELIDPVSITGYIYDKDMIKKFGGPDFISDCYTASPNPAHVRHYAAEVLKTSKRRQMLKIATDLAHAVLEGSKDTEDWRDVVLPILRRADAAITDGAATKLVHVKEVALTYAESGVENQIDPPVATGIKKLDEILMGGIRREYIIIGAKQGVGKTLLAMQMAGKLANAGRRGFVIGLEMTALQIFMRDLARETGVTVSQVMGRGDGFVGSEIQTITRGISRIMEDWDVWYAEDPYLTIEAIAAHARSLHRIKPLDWIVIDYLQLVPMKRGGRDRSDELLVQISNQVERLRKELGCTLIAPVQINDDGMIRDARGILDAPQLFLRIEMEKIENEDGDEQTGNDGFVQILKQRFGKSNTSCPIHRNGLLQRFEDRDMPDRKVKQGDVRRRR